MGPIPFPSMSQFEPIGGPFEPEPEPEPFWAASTCAGIAASAPATAPSTPLFCALLGSNEQAARNTNPSPRMAARIHLAHRRVYGPRMRSILLAVLLVACSKAPDQAPA